MYLEEQVREQNAEVASAFANVRAESGRTLLELVDAGPVLLVFLRHFGCSFCRQAIDDVSKVRSVLADRGIRPVFVHMGTPERAKPYFDYYDLADTERISNPDGSFYHSPVFELGRVSLLRILFQPAVWKGWMQNAMIKHGIGLIREDASQMPGVFFLRDRKIVRSFRHRTIADRPDYLRLVA
ncbi:AhpC/TSA family protein [Alloacidobacterium dinghuense]|uniref:AhpC/TSA family protein n=1 Tax=Alloacidobacterium dinghuense TaxID=2763107 RepID=A0A7G8BII4_9BACT|nr:SelL-related redox protein [Alloacidobacterium dinghuense]QNI32354.1 AhpC/TSA family protein [Alloacidobacterium dinghuense]